jgi:hypothetical protein
LNFVFDTEKNKYVDPNSRPVDLITEADRDQLQVFIDTCGLDVKTVCEHFGIDALTQIEAAKLENVKQEIEQLAKQEITA